MHLEQRYDNPEYERKPFTVKIIGDLSQIQKVRNCLQKKFKVLKSSPCYENEGRPGFHTFLTLEVDPQWR